jgi:hypothetical protein
MESLLEKIEQEIECLEPSAFVLVGEFLEKYKPWNRKPEIEEATIMLLQKYGITYRRY